MPSNRQVVIFDNSPMEDAPWIQKAAQMAGVKVITNDPITTELGKDPDARKVLEKRPAEHGVTYLPAGPYFQKALEKTIAAKHIDAGKLGLVSVQWLEYGTKAECAVLDLDPVYEQIEIGRKSKMKEEDVKKYEAMFATKMQETAKKFLSADRVLVLPRKINDAQKAELAAAHIKKFVK